LAAPDRTLHDWAIESIRHSTFVAEPSGVPSSKKARRYQSPSQPWRSSARRSDFMWARQRSALERWPRASAIGAKAARTVYRNQPSQTLSPRPLLPTRFMPSFQSPVPMNGSPWAPTARLRSRAATQWSNSEADSGERSGWK
jgi:hypothetical protein